MDASRLIFRVNFLVFLSFVGFLRWLGGTLEVGVRVRVVFMPSLTNTIPPKYSSTSSVFDGFRSILETDLRSVLTSVNMKLCGMNLLPRFIITSILDEIAP